GNGGGSICARRGDWAGHVRPGTQRGGRLAAADDVIAAAGDGLPGDDEIRSGNVNVLRRNREGRHGDCYGAARAGQRVIARGSALLASLAGFNEALPA